MQVLDYEDEATRRALETEKARWVVVAVVSVSAFAGAGHMCTESAPSIVCFFVNFWCVVVVVLRRCCVVVKPEGLRSLGEVRSVPMD